VGDCNNPLVLKKIVWYSHCGLILLSTKLLARTKNFFGSALYFLSGFPVLGSGE